MVTQPSESRSVHVDGIGFGGALFILFLALKLTHVIAWSWWWVCAPLWAPVLLAAIIATIGIILLGIGAWLGNR